MRFISHVVQATYKLTIKTHLTYDKEINKRVLKIYTFFPNDVIQVLFTKLNPGPLFIFPYPH